MSIKTALYTLAFGGLLNILGCKTPQEIQPTLANTITIKQPAETTETPPEKPIETQLEEAYQALPDQTYQTLTRQYATTEQKVELLIDHLISQHARSPLNGHKNITPSCNHAINYYKAEIKTNDKYGRTIFYTAEFYSIPPTQKEHAQLIKKKLLQQGLTEKELEQKLYLSSLIITAKEEDATNLFFDQEPADGFLEKTTINNTDYYRRKNKDFFQPYWTDQPPKKILTAKQIQTKYEQALDNILDAYELD